MIDYSKIPTGHIFSYRAYRLDMATLDRYVESVGGRSMDWGANYVDRVVPPMAVAAMSLRGVIGDLALPPGSLHAGQELQFKGSVTMGEDLDCRATLVQNSIRGNWRYIVVQLTVLTGDREVMTGKSTLVLPVN